MIRLYYIVTFIVTCNAYIYLPTLLMTCTRRYLSALMKLTSLLYLDAFHLVLFQVTTMYVFSTLKNVVPVGVGTVKQNVFAIIIIIIKGSLALSRRGGGSKEMLAVGHVFRLANY